MKCQARRFDQIVCDICRRRLNALAVKMMMPTTTGS